jgi:hypothetical protein
MNLIWNLKQIVPFQSKLEDLADENTEYKYWKFETAPKDIIVGYKQILNETKSPELWSLEETDGRYRYVNKEDMQRIFESTIKRF